MREKPSLTNRNTRVNLFSVFYLRDFHFSYFVDLCKTCVVGCPIDTKWRALLLSHKLPTFVNPAREGSATFSTRFNKLFKTTHPGAFTSASRTGYGIIQRVLLTSLIILRSKI